MFQTWLHWFETAGSGMEWPKLATVEKECCQLYEKYKQEDWICIFDKHFAPVDPLLEFLMEDLVAEMMVSTMAVASTSNPAKHPLCELAVTTGVEQSKGHGSEGSANCGDIGVAGPLTPKHVVGSISKGLAMLPRVVTTLKIKGKGKDKARLEEEEEIKELVEDLFTNKCLVSLLCWQKALTVVNTGMGAGVVLKKAKGKSTVLLEKEQAFRQEQGAGYDKRVAGVKRQFRREMEKAREELWEARARFTIVKQLLATLAGYQGNCQAFLAWQEENNIGEEDWEEGEMEEVPSNDANLDT
ncbi:hypothetical protein C0989_009489 [Termitomyces sp. Mn162]|nr:hypothetical protein C0989_009489 [Termitomyces sp. Mn162]